MGQHSVSDDTSDPVERKLQLTGNSTFVISLPKDWALEQGLESGMSMYLYPHDDRVVAAPAHISERDRTATIDAQNGESGTVKRQVRSAYATGCDRITVTGLAALDAETRRQLERSVSRLVGIEIQDATDETLTIQNLLDASEVSLSQTVAQARQLALELYGDAVEAVLRDDDELAQRVISRDDDVDRLFMFVSRGFHRGLEDVREVGRLGTNRTVAFREYRIARELERIADHAGRIAPLAGRQSGPPDDDLRHRLETITNETRAVVELAVAGETAAATRGCTAVRTAVEQIDQQLYERTDPDMQLYGSMVRELLGTAESGVTIAETMAESRLEE